MLQGKSANELGLASTAVLTPFIKRLVAQKTLPRATALALLGNAADELGEEASEAHKRAAELIRNEIVPVV